MIIELYVLYMVVLHVDVGPCMVTNFVSERFGGRVANA